MIDKSEIELVKDFRFRHEDFYLLGCMAICSIPIHGIFLSIAKADSYGIFIGIAILDLLIIGSAIFHAWYYFNTRKEERCFIDNARIIKKYRNQVVFDIPMSEIVSVRVQNKKGKEGTIILFTNKESLNYFIAYGLNSSIPNGIHGFTDYKISFAKDRKWLLTEIYKHNSKLHFIESH